jgi:ABC-type Fe3+/spermidine/putrescine transport system ATPase subunit
MVRLEGIKKTYSDFAVSLDFSIRRGELVSLLGPSGSGKTTALRIIAGFERPDEGRIFVDGRDVTGLDPSRRRIGFVFQDYTLFPHLDAGDNIAYGLKHRGLRRDEIKSRVEELLSTVGLPGFGGRRVSTLSGGEQQRIAVARSLAVDPLVLMLDEPFSSIDSVLRRDLREEILRLQKKVGITTLFITHDREEAFSVSDRVILLRNGSVVQTGPPEELYDRPVDRFAASFVGPANFFTGRFAGAVEGRPIVKSFADFQVSDPWGKTAGAAAGTRVTFMVRSDKLRFSAAPGDNTFPALITGRRYYGHYREYLCETDAGPVGVYSRSPEKENGPCRLSFASGDGVVVETEPAEG